MLRYRYGFNQILDKERGIISHIVSSVNKNTFRVNRRNAYIYLCYHQHNIQLDRYLHNSKFNLIWKAHT